MVSMSKAKMDPRPLPKRFYAAANYAPHEDGFVVTLDGKVLRTPQKKLLHAASQQLMQQIAEEWNAQKDVIDTDTMPLTRLLNITLDRVPLDRELLLADIAQYGETDLLCYRAPLEDYEDPEAEISNAQKARESLGVMQDIYFTPMLEWLEKTYGMQFVTTEGIMPVPQPQASLDTLRDLFATANDHELAALAMMVPLLGSALLALLLWKGAFNMDSVLTAAHLDETAQAEHWGEDPETSAKWNAKCRDIRAAAFFLTGK